ncbi:MAG: nucleoside deaminase [Myxococcales bacterium]|nr:nucleoside deaminase [Myxococcales bacterium]
MRPVIVQPPRAEPRAFIERAFVLRNEAERAGDQPFGAVVVRDNVIVGQAASEVVRAGDPTLHAELAAIRDTALRLGRRDLTGCRLYSSAQPCPMCEAAAYWAGIERLIWGLGMADGGAPQLRRC